MRTSMIAVCIFAGVTTAFVTKPQSKPISPTNNATDRKVSFWYDPAAYAGGDINNTLDVLKAHPGVVTNVFIYCGHAIVSGGLTLDEGNAKLCLETNLISGLQALDIVPEIVINSGNSDVVDYRNFFANDTANLNAITEEAARFGVKGVSFDLEPQVGIPASTAEDAVTYAAFLSKLRPELAKTGVRLTIAVAQWSPMLRQYTTLAPSVDRLLNMEQYQAMSMKGWLDCDTYGGCYSEFVKAAGPIIAAPGMGVWNATCGHAECWTSTAASVAPRMAQIVQDGVEEVACFRLLQQDGTSKMPLDFWWPALTQFRQA